MSLYKNESQFNKQGGLNAKFGDTELKKENKINGIQCTDEVTKLSGIFQTYLWIIKRKVFSEPWKGVKV